MRPEYLRPRRQAPFFGSREITGMLVAPWKGNAEMTATAISYTSNGFALAADGRERWEQRSTRDAEVRASERDSVQKIFELTSSRARLAFTTRGHVANLDRTFVLDIEIRRQIVLFHGRWFWSCERYVRALMKALETEIRIAKSAGILASYPGFELCFVGYFKGKPSWVDAVFEPMEGGDGLEVRVTRRTLRPGMCEAAGSDIVRARVAENDSRVEHLSKLAGRDLPLMQAAELVTGWVEACCSEWAYDLDREHCGSIGGHVHVATLSREDGFRWVRPPLFK